jgi:hypothetical protein
MILHIGFVAPLTYVGVAVMPCCEIFYFFVWGSIDVFGAGGSWALL